MRDGFKYKEKCIGSLLGTAVGDILGAGVEGYSREMIQGTYGELRNFLSTGRGFGCYTDDTEMTLALAQSIVDCNGMDAQYCARAYAAYYNPWRGYGGGAHAVMKALKQGADYRKTGVMMFKDGSYGNGGAMRIAPVGLVYGNKTNEELRKAVVDALLCTHVHPEGIDGAVIQAKAVGLLVSLETLSNFDPPVFLEALDNIADTGIMKEKISYLQDVLTKDIPDEVAVARLGNGIRASEAVSCALLAVVKYHSTPEAAVIKSVGFGGDTDTIGAMTSAQLGALHGKDWIPKGWLDNMENKTYGRDYIIKLASELSQVSQSASGGHVDSF
jgi:poly(ADP-ribose) glycohydrolase ARH3